MGDVDEWLERLGLSRYRSVFAEHDIDREILPDLTDQDLEKLGLSLGHRKKLLRAIAELPRPDSAAQQEPARKTAGRAEAGTREAPPHAAERRQLTVLKHTPSVLGLLAALYIRTRKSREALNVLDEALARVNRLENAGSRRTCFG
jgi:hypothetical protein